MLYDALGEPLRRDMWRTHNFAPNWASRVSMTSQEVYRHGLVKPNDRQLRQWLDASVAAINAAPLPREFRLVKRQLGEIK